MGPQSVIAAKALSVRGESGPDGPGPVCTDERCQPEPRSCSRTAFTRPGVVVADDEADPAEAALDERADEARARPSPRRCRPPARGPGSGARPGRDAGRDEGRHRHDPSALADLAGTWRRARRRGSRLVERPGAEGLHLGVERGADPAHLAAADALEAERPDEVVDTPRAHAPARTPPGRPRAGRARPDAAARAGSGSTSRRGPAGSRGRWCPPGCPSAGRGTRCGDVRRRSGSRSPLGDAP